MRLWDVADPAHPRPFSQPLEIPTGSEAGSAAFASDGSILATSFGGALLLWDVADPAHPRELATLEGHDAWVSSVAFAPDGKILASGSDDKTVRLWALR